MTLDLSAPSRRAAFAAAAGLAAGAALVLPGCAKAPDKDVGAVEDLMREHGILRRLLVVYRETAASLRMGGPTLDGGALAEAVDLFRAFGEDYHEKKLEEAHIFPMVKTAGGPGAAPIDVLIGQHDRGRQLNAYIEARAKAGLSLGDKAALASVLESFARMYEAHAAIEDTVVFQAWRNALSAKDLDEWGDKFEDIEKATFKGDGFDMAADRVAGVEQRLGVSGLGRFTAPPPPP